MIKQIQALSLALFLMACSSGGTTTVNLAALVSQIQATCGFVTSIEDIAKVAVTLVAGFNPALGASATVAEGIANTIVDSVCGQVKAKASTTAAGTPALQAAPQEVTIVVNGVPIKGHMQGK
jgi:hypothetical protein